MGEGILFGPLVLFSAAMCLTPGPNVVMITASAANFGFRGTIPQMLGITLGFGAMVTACGLGLSGLFRAEPRLHIVLKYAGTAYLIYLAWRIANAGSASHDAKRGRPIGFAEAALFTWANPKSWVTAIGALAAYSTLGGSMFVQTLVIAGVLAAACLVSVVMWAAFGAAIARLLVGRRARLLFNYSMACLLVLSLAPIFL